MADTETDDDAFEEDFSMPTERWAPLGSAEPPAPPVPSCSSRPANVTQSDPARLRELEEEQEELNTSLLELTTHFAQVQFRLQQICKAPPEEKEALLSDLMNFASRGCPDIMEVKNQHKHHRDSVASSNSVDAATTSAEHAAIMESKRTKQFELIAQLKEQLEDLERFAYESGEGGIPSSEVMEKQRVIINSLQNKIDLKIEELDKVSNEDLQRQVDQAVKRLINPMKVKDKLVEQLNTQIEDLHRFIEFLQGPEGRPECTCLHEEGSAEKGFCLLHHPSPASIHASKSFGSIYSRDKRKHASEAGKNGGFADTLYLIQYYILTQLGCQSRNQFRKNELKKSTKGCHWGDLRAALELAIDSVCDAASREKRDNSRDSAMLHEEDEEEYDDVFAGCSEELIISVRKELCPAIKGLLQHGQIQPGAIGSGGSVVPFGCLPARSRSELPEQTAHAWDIILKYYDMKHGREFNDMPLRKLSQSFNLENIGGKSVTSKQLLLATIDNILSTHTKLKRSPDAHFKAFVSAALNNKKLVAWLRMILRTREIVEENYTPWSYIVRTGFEDGLKSLERVQAFHFHLPVDLAVRPFQTIKDAF